MAGSKRPFAIEAHRSKLGVPAFLSLVLHSVSILALLIIPATKPLTNAPGPLSIDIIVQGAAEVAQDELSASAPAEEAREQPTTASASLAEQSEPPLPSAPEPVPPTPPTSAPEPAPDVSPAKAAETPPPPTPDITPSQESETPPPQPETPPAQQIETPASRPETRPIQQLQPPSPPSSQAVSPSPPLPRARATQSAEVRSRLPARSSNASASSGGQKAASGGGGPNNDAAWMGKLKEWWDQHSFYPKEASQTNEGGNVRVRISIAPDGRVTAIRVLQGSGLSALDAAAVAVFRNAQLSTSGMPTEPADLVVTLHYHPN